MSLQQQIVDGLKQAMLARQAERVNTLRFLKSAFGYAQIEKKSESLTDAEVLVVLQKEAKKRKDAIAGFTSGGRAESAANEHAELQIIEEFLPKALSVEEMEALVKGAIAEVGATSKKEMGAVMKAVAAKAGGRADGKVLSGLVGKLLP